MEYEENIRSGDGERFSSLWQKNEGWGDGIYDRRKEKRRCGTRLCVNKYRFLNFIF